MSKKYFVLVALCVLAMTGSAFGQNLLLNPGFETWTAGAAGPPDNWYSSHGSLTGSQEAVIVNSGTYSCNLTWTTTTTCYLIQDVAVTPAQDYTFSFMAYDNDTGGRLRIAVRWYQADNTTFISGYYGGYTDVDMASWQPMTSGPQTAPALAAFAHVEIRCYDISGWPNTATGYVDDAVFEESVAPPPDTVSIYDIQYTTVAAGNCYDSPLVGTSVVTQGVVSAVYAYYGSFWIQEAAAPWSGVYVYGNDVTPAVGDLVQVEGDVIEYYGLTEISNATVTILGSPGAPTPLLITTADLAEPCNLTSESYEGMLVKLENVKCAVLASNWAWWVYSECGSPDTVQIDDDLIYQMYEPDYVGQNYDYIIGIAHYAYDEFQINPRDLTDIGVAVAIELASFEATAGDGQVNLAWRTAAEVQTHSFNIYRDGVKIASVPAFGDAHDYTYVDRDVQNGTAYSYQLSDVDLDGTETMHPMVCSVTPNAVPGAYALNQNYPNPFNPNTEISYAIPAEAHVSLTIYNLLGQEITTLVDEVKEAGQHAISWNAAGNASGVYFYHLQTDEFSATKKMVFMK
ncbi:T9SS type A sorting domain-containing protein [Candidatus Zixiibacteriota bacterium]